MYVDLFQCSPTMRNKKLKKKELVEKYESMNVEFEQSHFSRTATVLINLDKILLKYWNGLHFMIGVLENYNYADLKGSVLSASNKWKFRKKILCRSER